MNGVSAALRRRALAPLWALLSLLPCAAVDARPAAAPLAPGQPFPRLTGRMLTAREGALPDAVRGRTALLLLGFTYASRHPVADWAARFRERFGSDTTVTLFEVPMIGGMARMASPFIESGMRKGTPPELRERVLIVYGDTRDWKARVGWSGAARDDAHLLLLDPEGRVRWMAHGAFDPEVFESLAREVGRVRPRTADPASSVP